MYLKFTANQNRNYFLFPLPLQAQWVQAFYIVLQDWNTMLYPPEGCYTMSFVSSHILPSKSLIIREFWYLSLPDSNHHGSWEGLKPQCKCAEELMHSPCPAASPVQGAQSLHLLIVCTPAAEQEPQSTALGGRGRRYMNQGDKAKASTVRLQLNSTKKKGVLLPISHWEMVTLGRGAGAQKPPHYPPATETENTQGWGRAMSLVQKGMSLL